MAFVRWWAAVSFWPKKCNFFFEKKEIRLRGKKLMVVYYILSLDGTNVIRSAWMSTKKELSCEIYCQKCIQISDPLRTSKTCVCQSESDLAFFSVDSVAPSSTECTQHLIGSCQESTLTKNPNHKHFSVTSHTLPFYSKNKTTNDMHQHWLPVRITRYFSFTRKKQKTPKSGARFRRFMTSALKTDSFVLD